MNWIRVQDALPDRKMGCSDDVLVVAWKSVGNGEVRVGYFNAFGVCNCYILGGNIYGDVQEQMYVTHWMPFPSVPFE